MQRLVETAERRQGQALIVMALAIVALAAIAGLAIDGGRLYELRRQVQNGADASAMAGTRELAELIVDCGEPSGANDLRVAAKVLEFAAANGVDEASPDGDVTAWYVDRNGTFLDWVGLGGIPTGATGVSARLVATDTTTFMRAVGQDNLAASGEATAMTGRVTALGGGVLPLAVPEGVVELLSDGDTFYVKDSDFGQFCREYDDLCYLKSGAAPLSERGWLQLGHIYNDASWYGPIPPGRAFANNTSNRGCDSDIAKIGLKGWADPNCPYPYSIYAGTQGFLDGDFIAGMTGEKNASLTIICESYSFDGTEIVHVPIFDYIYNGTCNSKKGEICMDTVFPGGEPGVGWLTGASQYYYHIVGFAAVVLQGIDSGSCTKGDLYGGGQTTHTLYGTFVSETLHSGEFTPSGGISSGACTEGTLMGVSLWE